MNKLWDKVGLAPWDIEIDRAVKRGIDERKARTFTIYRWMWHGDFRPLITGIRDNEDIDHHLLNEFIAYMALEGRLTVTRKRGRPRNPEAAVRNIVAGIAYEQTEGSSSDERFDRIAGIVGTSHQRVRQAVTAHRKRRQS